MGVQSRVEEIEIREGEEMENKGGVKETHKQVERTERERECVRERCKCNRTREKLTKHMKEFEQKREIRWRIRSGRQSSERLLHGDGK